MEIFLSHFFNILWGRPFTSFPNTNTRAALIALVDLNIFSLSLVCSRATISTPSFLILSTKRLACLEYSHGTTVSAPRAVFDIFSWGGVGVIPHKYILLTPAASAVLKIEPTFSLLLILCRITLTSFFIKIGYNK